MVRRRPCAVSNHEAPVTATSFETRRRRRCSGWGLRAASGRSKVVVVSPHGEKALLRRLEPRGPDGGLVPRDAAKTPLLRMRFESGEWEAEGASCQPSW